MWNSSPASTFSTFMALSSSALARAWAWMMFSSTLSASVSRQLYSATSCYRQGWNDCSLSCHKLLKTALQINICLWEVNGLIKYHEFTSINWLAKTPSFPSFNLCWVRSTIQLPIYQQKCVKDNDTLSGGEKCLFYLLRNTSYCNTFCLKSVGLSLKWMFPPSY